MWNQVPSIVVRYAYTPTFDQVFFHTPLVSFSLAYLTVGPTRFVHFDFQVSEEHITRPSAAAFLLGFQRYFSVSL